MRRKTERLLALPLGLCALLLLTASATHCGTSNSSSSDPDASSPNVDGSLPPGTDGGPSDPSVDGGALHESGATSDASIPNTTSSAVLTFRKDNFRTGGYLNETALDVAKVRARGMTVLFTNPVVGDMNAQPLYVPGLTGVDPSGKARDVVFVATLENNVYAFDANEAATGATGTSTKLWEANFVDPEDPTARPFARGIYSTPVIDLPASTMYLVYSTRNTKQDTGKLTAAQTDALDIAFYLVAIDIRTGKQLRIQKLAATYPKADGTPLAFEARNHWCRPALLLSGGSLYVACGMRNHELTTIFRGWVFRYDAATLTQHGTFCTAPDVNDPGQGASIWQSGSGLAEDPEGNVYFITGNGPADFANRKFGDALVKLSTAGNTLALAAAFTPEGPDGKLAENDVDFGAGGALVLPGTPFVLGAGKTGIAYLIDRGSMGKMQEFQAAVNQYDPTAPVDIDWEGGPHMHGTPAFWRGPGADTAYVYAWGEQDYLRRHKFTLSTGRFDISGMIAGKDLALKMTMPGGTLSVSAHGNDSGTGIVWATLPAFADPDNNPGGRLLAYDAESLEKLWETQFPSLPKWMPPTIADGKVIVGTTSDQFLIYGLGSIK